MNESIDNIIKILNFFNKINVYAAFEYYNIFTESYVFNALYNDTNVKIHFCFSYKFISPHKNSLSIEKDYVIYFINADDLYFNFDACEFELAVRNKIKSYLISGVDSLKIILDEICCELKQLTSQEKYKLIKQIFLKQIEIKFLQPLPEFSKIEKASSEYESFFKSANRNFEKYNLYFIEESFKKLYNENLRKLFFI